MIDPASVAFDVDGVVADTMTLFLEIARQEFNINSISYADITRYNLVDCLDIDSSTIDAIVAQLLSGNYKPELKPIDGAAEVLALLATRCQPILFVTARPHIGPLDDWFNNVLHLDPDHIEIIAAGSHEAKADILRQHRVTYFIDDRLETCFLLREAGIQPILFVQPWNRESHPFIEVGSWSELESLFGF
jgi:uncharacterized HAD superfamily protein